MSRTTRTIFILLTAMLSVMPGHAADANRFTLPWVLRGYRSLGRKWLPDTVPTASPELWRHAQDSLRRADAPLTSVPDSIPADSADLGNLIQDFTSPYDPENPIGKPLPDWLSYGIQMRNLEDELMFRIMMEDPHYIDYAEWDLPIPPTLPEQDYTLIGYIRGLHLPQTDPGTEELVRLAREQRYNWLHTVNLSLQLSQAYISANWYQGGSNYLAFFGNFLWDVNLNEVFHPKLMFQSTLNYKLAINSTNQDKYHKYAISQELFQYNAKFGYRARHNWYYSLTALFKTQFLNSYGRDSEVRTASFLSPATLNVGAGMTYNLERPKKRLKFSVSIAPISYNLRICIDNKVDHGQFSMEPGQHTMNEYGSNAEVNFTWAFRNNISYKTRLFLFTDYKNFTSDWENTFNFQWTKLFSTQIYVYLRYDSASDPSIAPHWKKWMLKEILSVGLSYTFSTKIK